MTEIEPASVRALTSAKAGSAASQLSRLLPVDAMRGFIIVVMALDHANFFVAGQHPSPEHWGLPMPVYPDAMSFLTRFVTHIAAPGFFFLMGVGMLMFSQSRGARGWTKWRIMRHFWIRGGLLILLQLLLVNRAWEMSPDWGLNLYFGVLFALGGTMILGSFVLWFRPTILLLLAIIFFFGTELIHPDPTQLDLLSSELPRLLLLHPGGENSLWVNYPILPWLELVLFGMFFGHWLLKDEKEAYRRGLLVGGAFIVTFMILRWFDGFGNVRPREGDAWIDFLNLVKYPPSMTFTLLTMGINLTFLWVFSKLSARPQFLMPLAVFGRSPLFFYILHLFMYAVLGMLLTPQGTSFPIMYIFWIVGLILLYPLCFFYGRFKAAQPAGSIAKLF